MALTIGQRAVLAEKLRIKAGVSDTDARFQVPALVLHETQTQNTSSSTVEVKAGSLVLVGNSSGTDTVSFGTDTTLDAVVTAISTAATGVEATRIAPDGDEPSTNLLTIPASDILTDDLTLYAFSTQLLDQLLDEALARAEAACRTKLFNDGVSVDRTMWIDGKQMHTDDAPLVRLNYMSVETEDAFRATYSGAGRGSIEVAEGELFIRTQLFGSSETVTTFDLEADTEVQDAVDVINALTGWSATLLNNGPSLDLVVMGTQKSDNGRPITVERWQEADGEYRVDYRAGIVHMDELVTDYGHSRSAGQVRMRYLAGYTDLPADLEGLILNTAKAGLDAMGQTAGLASEKLGDYSYTLAPGASSSAAMDDALMAQSATISRYMRRLP